MLVDWPTETFVLRLHGDPGMVARPAVAAEDGAVVLAPEDGGGRQEWVAERFRAVHARLRHAATGLYLTAQEARAGAAVTLRPKFSDSGADTSYWRQAWRAFAQRENGRLMAVNDLSGCVLGLGSPAAGGRPVVLEITSGAQDRICTAWAPTVADVTESASQSGRAAGLTPGTGRVRVTARLYERRSRVIESVDEPYLLQVAGRTLPAGTILESFAFDEFSRPAWYRQEQESGLAAYTEGFEAPGRVRKTFHRLTGDPAFYVDADEVDVHYAEPKVVARTNFRTPLFLPVGGSEQLLRTNHRYDNGHPFYNQPERREGHYYAKRDGAGTVDAWNKSWIADKDTAPKVFLSFDGGRYFIDARDVTWATD
ncbi:hypothetical protein A6A06_37510 [Streptomyces sp. CB02923]|uniref:RICIN domain-containing protein n=1 Tax=Streptomyces sp. CB02923 TaxID=1718985 RepID=UPI00093C8A70|nr:RICIN domain-containing protein [Streptomyces sp. CB02923]OKI06206.1 hypothetical protein A6A06_37510 [Streptomyces sp. CB02923]